MRDVHQTLGINRVSFIDCPFHSLDLERIWWVFPIFLNFGEIFFEKKDETKNQYLHYWLCIADKGGQNWCRAQISNVDNVCVLCVCVYAVHIVHFSMVMLENVQNDLFRLVWCFGIVARLLSDDLYHSMIANCH